MNYESSIHTFEFVHGFNSGQRFSQTHHGRMMLQRHVKCSSVQCRMTVQSYLIKNANFRGKKWCLAFSTLFDVNNAVWPCCACLYLRSFCFHKYNPQALQIYVDLTNDTFLVSREKIGGEVCIFSWNHDVRMFDILSERDAMHQLSCLFYPLLTRSYAKETLLGLSKTWVDYNTRFSISVLCTKNNNNYRTSHRHIRPQSDVEHGINQLRPKVSH